MTLAQDYLDHGQIPETDDETLSKLYEWADIVIRHALSVPLSSEGAVGSVAERFVFEIDAPRLVREMVASGQIDKALPGEIARVPADWTWIEFPLRYSDGDPGRIGSLIFLDDSVSKYRMILVGSSPVAVSIVGCATLTKPPPWPRDLEANQVLVHWFGDELAGGIREVGMKEMRAWILETVDCLFLLNIPRASELRTTTWGKRKQKTRERSGKPPLIELRHVVVRIGASSPRYPRSGSSSEDHIHRKLHQVIGHLRVYRKGRESPHLSYVPGHWRGDPKLGMILHERKIK